MARTKQVRTRTHARNRTHARTNKRVFLFAVRAVLSSCRLTAARTNTPTQTARKSTGGECVHAVRAFVRESMRAVDEARTFGSRAATIVPFVRSFVRQAKRRAKCWRRRARFLAPLSTGKRATLISVQIRPTVGLGRTSSRSLPSILAASAPMLVARRQSSRQTLPSRRRATCKTPTQRRCPIRRARPPLGCSWRCWRAKIACARCSLAIATMLSSTTRTSCSSTCSTTPAQYVFIRLCVLFVFQYQCVFCSFIINLSWPTNTPCRKFSPSFAIIRRVAPRSAAKPNSQRNFNRSRAACLAARLIGQTCS